MDITALPCTEIIFNAEKGEWWNLFFWHWLHVWQWWIFQKTIWPEINKNNNNVNILSCNDNQRVDSRKYDNDLKDTQKLDICHVLDINTTRTQLDKYLLDHYLCTKLEPLIRRRTFISKIKAISIVFP